MLRDASDWDGTMSYYGDVWLLHFAAKNLAKLLADHLEGFHLLEKTWLLDLAVAHNLFYGWL